MHYGRAALIFMVVLGFAVTLSTTASDFGHSYQAYQKAIGQQDMTAAEGFAASAYHAGQSEFGKESIDAAKLALNWATALAANNKNAQAITAYQQALDIFKLHYDEKALELIDPLVGLAQVLDAQQNQQAKIHLETALDIAAASGNALLLANIQVAAFERLSTTRYYSQKVANYLLSAQQTFSQLLPENALDRLHTSYLAASVYLAENKTEQAEPLFLEVIKQFEVLDYSHPYLLASHARLVEIYEDRGDSELSTQHCVAIGSMKPWSSSQEQKPLYRVHPDYPSQYAKRGKEGWVNIRFTVNERGFVVSPKVIDSKGGKRFEKASLKALENWRYAPKFVEGKAVAAQTSVRLEYRLGG